MDITFDFDGFEMPKSDRHPDFGEMYHLSTDGYFFMYIPSKDQNIQVCLYKKETGSKVVAFSWTTIDEMNDYTHRKMINRFESGIFMDQF